MSLPSPADINASPSDHTHDISITSGGSSPTTLSASSTYTLSAGGKSVVFTTPADTHYSANLYAGAN